VTVDAIVADASASTADEITFSDSSSFVNLKVVGHSPAWERCGCTVRLRLAITFRSSWLSCKSTDQTLSAPLGTEVLGGEASPSLRSSSKP
jgi:hypothetical protein